MELTEGMLVHLAQSLRGTLSLRWGPHTISLVPPWARLPFFTALSQALGREVNPATGLTELAMALAAKGLVAGDQDRIKLWKDAFEALVEPTLVQPTFVVDFPVELSPLSKRKKEDARLVDRFELYIGCREIANAYTELNDPDEQRQRFEEQAVERARGDEEAHWFDEDYVRALAYGMPPTAGEGIGIDRLVMLLADQPSIREVILFPQLRHEGGRSADDQADLRR
jgi:lysyl-tRNA synthetase class 2